MQTRTRRPGYSKSCPDIPSTLEDFDFDPLFKSKSMNTSIYFKEHHESLQLLYREFERLQNLIETRRKNSTLLTLNLRQQTHHGNGSASSQNSSSQEEAEASTSDSSRFPDTALNVTSNSTELADQSHPQTTHNQSTVS